MSDEILGRVSGDLAIMQRALGLRPSFGKGMLAFNLLLFVAAMSVAVVSQRIESEWLQQGVFAAIVMLAPAILYLRAQRPTHEVHLQVFLSVVTYAVVWTAGCGYMLASFIGPALGTERRTLLYTAGCSLLFAFTIMLVRAAFRNRDRYYCLGLALSTLLAGMLLPILGQHYALAHACMALGSSTCLAIQWLQLREAAAIHAAD